MSHKKRLFLFLVLTASTFFTLQGRQKEKYQDPSLPVEQRVDDLISKMTLEEKAEQASAQLLGGRPRLAAYKLE